MKRLQHFALLLVMAGCAGCAEQQRYRAETARIRAAGARQAEFRQKSIQLAVGMNPNEVLALLGPPVRTEARTMGQALGQPWSGWVWDYGMLQLTFSRSGPVPRLNDWRWVPAPLG